jgi:hypothetical protein
MKLRKLFVFALFAALAAPGFADNQKVESDGFDVIVEIPVRAVTFGSMLGGFGIFVAISPLTGLMTIPPPHDAFPKLWDLFVCKPAKYTFRRPIGDYRYDEGCARKIHPVAYQPAVPVVKPPKSVVTKPTVQYHQHQDTNKAIDARFKEEMMK